MNVEQFKEIFSPWFDVVIKGFQDSFLKDYDIDILAFLHENIDREIKFSLSSFEKTQSLKRTKALYNVLTHLYEHILWKLRKGGSYACGKPGESGKDFPNATLTCVKLLSQLIRTGLILTQGLSKCEYIDRILMALKLFTGKQALLFDALLLVNGLKKIHHKPYSVILRFVLTTDYKEVVDPLFYMKIILLFRRLRALSDSKNKDLYFVAAKMKPPSNLISWLASLNVNGSASFIKLLQHKKIALQLLKENIPTTLLKRIRDLILGSYYFEENSNKHRHPKASEPFSELFITDTSPMQMQGDEVAASDISYKCNVKKEKTKKKKKKSKPNKNETLLNRKIENSASIKSGNSVLYVNSFSNLVVSSEPCSSLNERDDSDTYIIPESKNKISEAVSVSIEEHRKFNKRKSKCLQITSQSQNEMSNNNLAEEITISDSDSLVEMPPKKSKRNILSKNVSPKRTLSEDDNNKIQKTKKIKSVSSNQFSDAHGSNDAELQLGSEICGSAKNVKKSCKQRRHNLTLDDDDEISLAVEINKSEATSVSLKMESKEDKHDANSVSCPKHTDEGLARHDCPDHVPSNNKTSNQPSILDESLSSVKLSSPSKLPSSSKNYVCHFDGNLTVTDDLIPQKASESSANMSDTDLAPNCDTKSLPESNVLENIHNHNEKKVNEVVSKNSTDQPKITEVLNSNLEVAQKYCVTDNSNQENKKLDNSVKNIDTGSKTTLVLEEISEIAHNYSNASKIPEEINLSHQSTNDNSVPSTSTEESNKSDYHDCNSSTAQDPNTEKQATVQSNIPHDKMNSSDETSEVDSPINQELQQSFNEKTDKNSVSSHDLSDKNNDLGNVNMEEIDQEQYPSCGESGSAYPVVIDSKENFYQKDLAQCLGVSELDAKNNMPEKDMKSDIVGSKLDISHNNSLPETKIYRDMCEKIEENMKNDSVNNKNLHKELNTSGEDFESINTPFSEIKTADKTAETVNMENYSNSLQKTKGECIENLISQTSENISSPSCVPEIPLDSTYISDSKTKNCVTLPVKNILGETLNVVIADDTLKMTVRESDEKSPKTCESKNNLSQISNSESLNSTQSSTLMDNVSENTGAHETSSVVSNNSDSNGSIKNDDKTPKPNELYIPAEVALKESKIKSKTDSISLNDSEQCDIVNESKENSIVFTRPQEEAIISNSFENCSKLLEVPGDQISENISKENVTSMAKSQNDAKVESGSDIDAKLRDISHKTATKNASIKDPSDVIGPQSNENAEGMSENCTKSSDTIADKITNKLTDMTEKLTDMTELQCDMETKSVSVVDAKFNDNSVDSSKENITLLNNPQNDGSADNISPNDAVSCNISANKVTGNVVIEDVTMLTESHDEMSSENNSQITSKICDFSVDTAKESKPIGNNTVLTEFQSNEFVENISQNKAQSIDVPADKITEEASEENASVFTESENDVKTRNDSPLTVQMPSVTCETDPEGALEKKTEPQNDEKAEHISQSDARINFEDTFGAGAILTQSEDKMKLKRDLEIDPKKCHISGDSVTKNVSPSILEPIPSHNDLNAKNVIVSESKTCDISVDTSQEKALDNVQMTIPSCADDLEKDNVKLERDSEISDDPKKCHISGDTVMKNVTSSISEPTPSLNVLNTEKVLVGESKTCDNSVNTSQEKALDNVVQMTVSSSAEGLKEDNVNLEIVSQTDPKTCHISVDTVTKNLTLSISEATPSLNDLNVEIVLADDSKTCDISVNSSQEKALDNVVQKTLSPAYDLEDEHNLSKLTSERTPEEIDVETVSNDTQPERPCNSTVTAESSLTVPTFKNSKEFTKETKIIFDENIHNNFATSPLKNASKTMHSEYIPYFCKDKDYVSFSDISLRNKGKQIVADSCLKSPIAITNFPSAATAEIFCEYRNGIICSTKDVLSQEGVISKRSKSASVSSIASDASKSPCGSSIASDEEIETPQYSSAEEDLLVNDGENESQKESVQTPSDTADPSISLDTNEDCNTSKIQSDSRNDSSPSENIKSLEPSYDSTSPANQNESDIPDEESSEKICPRQSLRLKNKTDVQNKTDFSKDTESGVSVPETPPKSAANVTHNLVLKKCSVLCDNLPINSSPISTNSVPSSSQSPESCSSSQKFVSKEIPKSQVKLKQNKFSSPKKPYSLRHRKPKQICDNSSNLDLDLSKLQLDSPSRSKNTRSKTAKDAKFAKLLASKIDALKNDDGNDLNVPIKRETRSSAAKTEQDAVQNTPGYNLRNRKSIIAPSKLKI